MLNSRQTSKTDMMAKKISSAEAAASQAKARVYELTNHSTDANSTSFYIFGCQGNASKAQKEVAVFMDTIANEPTNKPAFILILGDNFYNWGVSSPLDPMFNSNFYDIYADAHLKNIADIPCFVILGNHDENLHHRSEPHQEKGILCGLHQVAHSYLPEENSIYDTTEKKKILYQQDKLNLSELPKWNMPNRFYSIIHGNTQLFCIDSNTYLSEYLQYNDGSDGDQFNQAAWLECEVNKAKLAGRTVLLAGHHPLHTPTARAYKSDLGLYVTPDQADQAKTLFGNIVSSHEPYNSYLRESLKTQGLTFDAIFAAHDHNISYYNNTHLDNHDYALCQITAGGGGGRTRGRKKFSTQGEMGCFLKELGFAKIDCDRSDDKKIIFNIHAKNGAYHHVYTNDSHLPTYQYTELTTTDEITKINMLFSVVRKSISEYFSNIGEIQDDSHGKFFKKNNGHGKNGVKCAHILWAYINNKSVPDYGTLINQVKILADMNSETSNHHPLIKVSFIDCLNTNMKETFKHDLVAEIKLHEKSEYEKRFGSMQVK